MDASTWQAVSGGIWGVLVAVTLLGSFAGAVWLSVHGTVGRKKHTASKPVAPEHRPVDVAAAPPKVPPAGVA